MSRFTSPTTFRELMTKRQIFIQDLLPTRGVTDVCGMLLVDRGQSLVVCWPTITFARVAPAPLLFVLYLLEWCCP